MRTIQQICSTVLKTGDSGKAHKRSESVIEGLDLHHAPAKTGLVQLTPNQALGVYVEEVMVNHSVTGYQRSFNVAHGRKIARALLAGEDVGEVTLAVDGGKLYATDGQHRLCGCVIARKPIWAVIRPMLEEERAARFANQSKSVGLTANSLVFAGSNPIHKYIKAAIVAHADGTEHGWAGLVGATTSSGTLSPFLVYDVVTRYSLGLIGGSAQLTRLEEMRFRGFKESDGDELAMLFSCFGTKRTNPFAFRPPAVRALTDAAIIAIVRTGKKQEDFVRWQRHMPVFDWAGYSWISHQRDLREQLLKHWNKRLSPGRKVTTT